MLKIWICLFLFSLGAFTFKGVESSCALPADLQGTWIDTLKGPLEFNNSVITDYNLHTFGALTLTCWMQNDTVYVFESSEFEFYSLNFTAYFCWNFTQVSSDMFYFYEYSPMLPGAGNERVRAYLPTLSRVYESICANPDPGLGTYRVLFRNGTLESSVSPCPSQVQAHHTYNVIDETGTNTCNDSSSSYDMDICTNSSAMVYNSSGCTTPFAYSYSGYVYCLFTVEDPANSMLYMSLFNDGEVDDSTTHSVTCMIINYGSSGTLVGTQYPRQCADSMNHTYVVSPGAYVNLFNAGSCTSSSSSAFPIWILGVVGGILFLTALIIIICCYKKKKDEEKKKRQGLMGDIDDDERYDPERFSRGDRPPFFSITIMGGDDDDRKALKTGNPGKDTGPVEIKRPKSDGGHRRLDKRKRVWVVDKDGKVKKVWKDERESPDSGVEADDVDGEGSTGRKTLSIQDEKDKEADDLAWAKRHGRKGMKSAKEIEEKGDRKQGSAKLQKKMKGMVSAKRSARYRRSAMGSRRGDKSAPYVTDDGERSWGSSDGEYEEVIIENEPETLEEAREAEDNKRNEEMERKRHLNGKDVEKAEDKLQGKAAVAAVVTATVVSEIDEKGKKAEKDKKANQTKKDKESDQKSKSTEEKAEKLDQKPKATDDKSGKKNQTEEKGKKDKGDTKVSESKKDAGKATKDTKNVPGDKTAGQGKEIVDPEAVTAVASTSVTVGESKEPEEESTDKSRGKGKGKKTIDKAPVKQTVKSKPQVKVTPPEVPSTSGGTEKAVDVTGTGDGTDPAISGKETAGAAAAAAGGAAAIAAAVAAAKKKEAEKKKEEKQREKEEKQKQKEEKKKEKEEQKRKEKEEKEKKKAAALKQEPVGKYVEVKPSGETAPTETPGTKQSDKDLGNKKDEKKAEIPSKPTSKSEKKGDDKQESQPPLSREQTLSSSMRPRREQSILLDLDRSKSNLENVEQKSSSAKDKTLEAVSELVETAREKADAFAEGKESQSPATSADPKSRSQPLAEIKDTLLPPTKEDERKSRSRVKSSRKDGTNEKASPSAERGKPFESKETSKNEKKEKGESKTVDKKGAKGSEKAFPGTKITVHEAKSGAKTDTLEKPEAEQTEETDFESSEDEFVPVKKAKPQGFTFPDDNMLASTFRTTGDIIHTMPVKKKKPRRVPRKLDPDVLPARTSQAFGIASKTKAAEKAIVSKPPSAAHSQASAKGPITIKDLSKKNNSQANDRPEGLTNLPNAHANLDLPDSGLPSGRSAKKSPSPNRRKSEMDSKQHLQLMTQLMSLSEEQESEAASRAQSRKGQSKSTPQNVEVAIANFSDTGGTSARGKNGTPELLQTARQDSVVAGRPPNQTSFRPSRENSANVPSLKGYKVAFNQSDQKYEDGVKSKSALSRSHSDKRTASVTFPDSSRSGNSKSSGSANSEDRFLRFKEGVLKQLGELGKQELNAIMYPRVQRYPEVEEPGKFRRGAPTYRSMGTLQRIHKRNRQVAPQPCELPPIKGAYGRLIDDYDDVDDPRMKGLLEELYYDKKYMDKTLAQNPEEDEFVRQRTQEGRSYLLNRARFWSTQQPIVRPGTTQQGASRASTAMPASRLSHAPRNDRARSEERPGK